MEAVGAQQGKRFHSHSNQFSVEMPKLRVLNSFTNEKVSRLYDLSDFRMNLFP